MGNFRIKNKHIFLTYSTHFLIKKFKELKIVKNKEFTYKLAWETGKTGYKHTHILLAFKRPIESKDVRCLDIPDIKHPNIVRVLTKTHWQNLIKYIDKDCDVKGNTLTGNEYEWLGTVRNVIQSHRTWNDVLNDDYLVPYVQKYFNWAKAVFQAKPKPSFKLTKLRKWQEQINKRLKELIEEENDRKVIWIYDPVGNSGKTKLCKHLLGSGAFLVTGGKSADNAYRFNYENTVLFNLTRTQEDYTPYALIEAFKDGMLSSPKYQSEMKIWNTSQVIVMANYYPDKSKLSDDRWEVYTLRDGILNGEQVPLEVLNIKKGTSYDTRNNNIITALPRGMGKPSHSGGIMTGLSYENPPPGGAGLDPGADIVQKKKINKIQFLDFEIT